MRLNPSIATPKSDMLQNILFLTFTEINQMLETRKNLHGGREI